MPKKSCHLGLVICWKKIEGVEMTPRFFGQETLFSFGMLDNMFAFFAQQIANLPMVSC